MDSNCLALMGFGFVVARFGLFLQTLRLGPADLALRGNGISPWIGTALIAMGIAVNIWCAFAHVRLVRQLKRGNRRLAGPPIWL
jgi:putative membrane protein